MNCSSSFLPSFSLRVEKGEEEVEVMEDPHDLVRTEENDLVSSIRQINRNESIPPSSQTLSVFLNFAFSPLKDDLHYNTDDLRTILSKTAMPCHANVWRLVVTKTN